MTGFSPTYTIITSIKNAELKKMSTSERLQTMEALWDSLVSEEKEISLPEWHNDVLTERQAKIDSGKAEFLSLSEVKAKYR